MHSLQLLALSFTVRQREVVIAEVSGYEVVGNVLLLSHMNLIHRVLCVT